VSDKDKARRFPQPKFQKMKARCEPLRNGPTHPTQVPSELTDNDHDPDVSGHDQIQILRADANNASHKPAADNKRPVQAHKPPAVQARRRRVAAGMVQARMWST
jgi:hypothetical protein